MCVATLAAAASFIAHCSVIGRHCCMPWLLQNGSSSVSITREQFEAWWRKSEGEADDGGKVGVLEKMQLRVTDLDGLSVEMEQQVARIQKLLARAAF